MFGAVGCARGDECAPQHLNYITQKNKKKRSDELLKSNLKIFLIFILIFNLFTTTSLAATAKEYDHEALMQYDGYGKAMYETIVDETSFITGQYTDNKEFVSESIDQIRDYGKFWWNEQNWESEPWSYDRFKEMIAKPAGFLLTVGDWVGKLFGGYGEKYYPPYQGGVNWDEYVSFYPSCKQSGSECEMYRVNPKYVMIIGGRRVTYSNGYGRTNWGGSVDAKNPPYSAKVRLYPWNYDVPSIDKEFTGGVVTQVFAYPIDKYINGDFGKVVYLNSLFGVSITFERSDTSEPVKLPNSNANFEKFKNRVYDNVNNVATPEPRPYLSCPNGSKIQMSVSG
ncbi:hypothetical protein, partial [Lysinibacillus xylanilyticus]